MTSPTCSRAGGHRNDSDFVTKRTTRINELSKKVAPLKVDRLQHQELIHGLQFEERIAEDSDKAKMARETAEAELNELQVRIAPLQSR